MKNLKHIFCCLLGVILLLFVIYYIYNYINNRNYEKSIERYNIMVKVENRKPSTDELKFSEDQLKIYYKISLLINGIQDNGSNEEDLIRLLDNLRNNLNHRIDIKALIIAINKKMEDGGTDFLGEEEKNNLNSILNHLSNEKIIQFEGINKYEENKEEIISLLPSGLPIKTTVKGMFDNFEENLYIYDSRKRAEELDNIRNTIIENLKKTDYSDFSESYTSYFCNIFEYYRIADYTNKC